MRFCVKWFKYSCTVHEPWKTIIFIILRCRSFSISRFRKPAGVRGLDISFSPNTCTIVHNIFYTYEFVDFQVVDDDFRLTAVVVVPTVQHVQVSSDLVHVHCDGRLNEPTVAEFLARTKQNKTKQ